MKSQSSKGATDRPFSDLPPSGINPGRRYSLKGKPVPPKSLPVKGKAYPVSPGVSPGAGAAGAAPAGLVNCAISHRRISNQDQAQAKSDFLQFCYDQAPVIGYRVMKNDVVTVRAARNPEELAERLEGSIRGDIEFLSMKSRRRLALVAGNSPIVFRSFVTVTYPASFPCDGKIVKRHLAALLCGLRRKSPGLAYLWFLEFQARGAPHIHLFLSSALPSPLSPMDRKSGRQNKSVLVHWPWQDWLSSLWFGIVGSGDEKHLRAGAAWEVIEKPDGAARYVAKESYKTFQKQVPKSFQNVGRFWGTSRGVAPDEGRLVYATPSQMAATFPGACFDESGNPFPVLFGAAPHAPLAPLPEGDKITSWKQSRGQTLMDLGKP